MRIVKTDQPGSVRSVQSQRIAEPVRSFRSRLGAQHNELHPMPELIDEQCMAVKVEQVVKRTIAVELPDEVEVISDG